MHERMLFGIDMSARKLTRMHKHIQHIHIHAAGIIYTRASYFTVIVIVGVSNCPINFVLHTRDYFTHRLCDKNRDSANLLIRLFFRPSNIADAAISIFNRYLRERQEEDSGYSMRRALRANSISSIARRRGGYPAGNDRSLVPAYDLSPSGDALCVLLVDVAPAAHRYIAFHDSAFSLGILAARTRLSPISSAIQISRVFHEGGSSTAMTGAICGARVVSMDRFDVLVDTGNSPFLPSTMRYRSNVRRYRATALLLCRPSHTVSTATSLHRVLMLLSYSLPLSNHLYNFSSLFLSSTLLPRGLPPVLLSFHWSRPSRWKERLF